MRGAHDTRGADLVVGGRFDGRGGQGVDRLVGLLFGGGEFLQLAGRLLLLADGCLLGFAASLGIALCLPFCGPCGSAAGFSSGLRRRLLAGLRGAFFGVVGLTASTVSISTVSIGSTVSSAAGSTSTGPPQGGRIHPHRHHAPLAGTPKREYRLERRRGMYGGVGKHPVASVYRLDSEAVSGALRGGHA